MRKLLLVTFAFLVSGSATMAQNKVNTKWHCSKEPVTHTLEVGDVPGHTYAIGQGKCEAASSDSGFPEKTADYTEFRETLNGSIKIHGRFNVTMENGDKTYDVYEASASTDVSKPASDKWKFVSGTGKYKRIKGSGTCAGKFNADQTSDWECTGTYSVGK